MNVETTCSILDEDRREKAGARTRDTATAGIVSSTLCSCVQGTVPRRRGGSAHTEGEE